MSDFPQPARNLNQFAKLAMFVVENGAWIADGSTWYQRAESVLRKPQSDWDSTPTRKRIYYVKQTSSEPVNPNDIEFPAWVQCYWDSQAGRWVVINAKAASSGQIIEFMIESGSSSLSGSSSSQSGDPDLCENQESVGLSEVRAKVVRRPCGVARVQHEDDDGYVTVIDSQAGRFLERRSEESLIGMSGFAALLSDGMGGSGSGSDSSGSGMVDDCQWVIIWMNWFVEKQFVTDVIFGSQKITIERANAEVWRYCELPKEEILGDTCEDSDSSSLSSGP